MGIGPTALDFNNGVVCRPVVQSESRKAHIHVYVDAIDIKDKSFIDSLKLPVLIFRAPYIFNFSNIPSPDSYYDLYAANKKILYGDIIDTERIKFKLEPYDTYNIDHDKIWNDFITLDRKDQEGHKHAGVNFTVPESGIYCVYIAPPDNQGIINIRVPVKFENEYGNLPYLYYKQKYDLNWPVAIGILLLFKLSRYIRKVTGKDFKNVSQLSMVSWIILIYILIPFIAIVIFQKLCLDLSNIISCSSLNSILLRIVELIEVWFFTWVGFIFALFSIGLGVFFNSEHLDRILTREAEDEEEPKISMLVLFFLVNLIVDFLVVIIQSSPPKFPFYLGLVTEFEKSRGSWTALMVATLDFIYLCFRVVWWILPAGYLLKIKLLIPSIPPSSKLDFDSYQQSSKLLRLTVWIVMLLPVTIGSLLLAFDSYNRSTLEMSIPKLPQPGSESRKIVYDLAIKFWKQEIDQLSPGVNDGDPWYFWIYMIVFVITFLLIWIKNNKGVALGQDDDDSIEYNEFSGKYNQSIRLCDLS
ncbi:uncharacterized protein SPAPADRAFT_67169 [Spathaspora passalidarum NRRL Y-27907]|uniref:Uncharacterized protein n=1 Tax=Spathaspora passalidarum (strain NRRL Y-27907 / 11-Y1) TaxID=619300 RepID=G3ANP0_SPAPN|nr:uncharacterized protein SPAPADRAFT_67169 [Spathaspora passalidarum NRRL Y-27907]EGW32569.1 hypothetical protein SPAPADRAFT_67169 [Spathaspora passalidarum NRRL Y-27907]